MNLIPLANVIEVKQYKMGEVILKEGLAPTHFYLVACGRAKAVKEEVVVRDTKTLGLHKQQKLRKLAFGMKSCKSHAAELPSSVLRSKNLSSLRFIVSAWRGYLG